MTRLLALAALVATACATGARPPTPPQAPAVWTAGVASVDITPAGPVWLAENSLALYMLVLWIRWSFLRVRNDQVLRLNCLFLFPLPRANLLAAAFLALRS